MKQVAKSKQKMIYTPQKRHMMTYAASLKEVGDAIANGHKIIAIFPWNDHIVVVQEYYE